MNLYSKRVSLGVAVKGMPTCNEVFTTVLVARCMLYISEVRQPRCGARLRGNGILGFVARQSTLSNTFEPDNPCGFRPAAKSYCHCLGIRLGLLHKKQGKSTTRERVDKFPKNQTVILLSEPRL